MDTNKIDYTNDYILNMFLKENMSVKSIIQITKLPRRYIQNIFKKNNIDTLKTTDSNKETEVIRLYLEKNLSGLQIGKILNISHTVVYKILKKHNIVQRSKSQLMTKLNNSDYEKYIEELPEFYRYRILVNSITDKQPLHLLSNYDKRGRAGVLGAYHVDHKYSVMEGFKNNISAEIIGHITNLEMIPWKDNLSKKNKCSISLNQLLKNYHENKTS